MIVIEICSTLFSKTNVHKFCYHFFKSRIFIFYQYGKFANYMDLFCNIDYNLKERHLKFTPPATP